MRGPRTPLTLPDDFPMDGCHLFLSWRSTAQVEFSLSVSIATARFGEWVAISSLLSARSDKEIFLMSEPLLLASYP